MSVPTAPVTSPDPGVAVFTFGWDTVFAIPVPSVNQAIVDHHSSPAGFSVSESAFTVTGSFGDWQICQGGDGKNVRLMLPLRDVNLTFTSDGKEFAFSNGEAIVEVQLHYIPHTDPASSSSNPVALVVRDSPPSSGLPVLSVIEVTLSPSAGTVTGALIQQTLSDWGNANLGQFAHVFAVVDLDRVVDQGQWGFVTPSYTSYAYLDGDTLADSIFAVLTMTGGRTGPSLSEQVSQAAIPPGSVGGFIVSQQRTLQDLVRPAIMQAYAGLTDENFLLSDDATELFLTAGTSVPLPPVTSGGVTYQPQLTQLTVKSNGQILTLQSFTTTSISLGITATCMATHWYTLTLGMSDNGQTLVFSEVQPPVILHEIEQSEGSIITQAIIATVAAVALIILSILTSGAALIAGGLVIGLILGADMIVPSAIQLVNQDDSPSIDLLLVNSVSPIRWTDSAVFKLDYGSLNVSLQLGGNPMFV